MRDCFLNTKILFPPPPGKRKLCEISSSTWKSIDLSSSIQFLRFIYRRNKVSFFLQLSSRKFYELIISYSINVFSSRAAEFLTLNIACSEFLSFRSRNLRQHQNIHTYSHLQFSQKALNPHSTVLMQIFWARSNSKSLERKLGKSLCMNFKSNSRW